MTVGGCSVQYEYKLLFTMMVGGTIGAIYGLQQAQSNSLQDHVKCFCSYLRIVADWQWLKSYWILEKQVPSKLTNKLWRPRNSLFV